MQRRVEHYRFTFKCMTSDGGGGGDDKWWLFGEPITSDSADKSTTHPSCTYDE